MTENKKPKKELTKEEKEKKAKQEYEQLVRRTRGQLKNMQYMWIASCRTSEATIDSMDDKDLFAQHRMEAPLWAQYTHKPSKQKTCLTCGKEVGKCEVRLVDASGAVTYYNDKCRECYEGTN